MHSTTYTLLVLSKLYLLYNLLFPFGFDLRHSLTFSSANLLPPVMMPQGIYLDTLNYMMRLAGSAARIRTYFVSREALTVVPDGSDIVLIEFGKIIESDGYQCP